MNEFLKLIEESPNGYVEKFKLAVNQKIVRNLSRNMIKELISYYKIYNPNFDEHMISCSSCPTSVLRFMITVGTAYFDCKSKEVEPIVELIEPEVIIEPEIEEVVETKEDIILPKSKNKNK